MGAWNHEFVLVRCLACVIGWENAPTYRLGQLSGVLLVLLLLPVLLVSALAVALLVLLESMKSGRFCDS